MASRRNAIWAAVLSMAALILTGVFALAVPAGHSFDATTLHGFMGLDRPMLDPLLSAFVQLGNPVVCALIGSLLVVSAVRRGRPHLAVAMVVILLGSAVTTEVLKLVLAGLRPGVLVEPGWSIGAGSWPSGHATAAMSLSMCAIMASPPPRRSLVAAAGVAVTIAVSFALVAYGGHLLSDVIGAFFVSALWTATALVVLRRDQEAPASSSWRSFLKSSLPAYAAVWGIAAAVVLGVLVARPEKMAWYLPDHTMFLAGALLIAVIAQAVVMGFARLLSTGAGGTTSV